METAEIIDALAAGKAAEAKDALNDLLSARAFEALEGKKQQLAQTLFNGAQEEQPEDEVEVQDTEDTPVEQ